MITQVVEGVRIGIDLDAGCRLASLRVGGHELLVSGAPALIDWGCYPMAPYAGRVREGRFAFGGREYRLPRTLGEHAIHGSVYSRRWEAESESWFATELGPDWPFPGTARQQIRLGPGHLDLRLEVHSDGGVMPAACGWHPWLRREVAGATARLDFRPGFMFERDAAGITTRKRRPVTPGPWDDCFGGVEVPPVVTWPGVLRLEIESTCDYWVVFDQRESALCVEPQSAPPDSLNHDSFVVEPGHPLVAQCRLRWGPPDSAVSG